MLLPTAAVYLLPVLVSPPSVQKWFEADTELAKKEVSMKLRNSKSKAKDSLHSGLYFFSGEVRVSDVYATGSAVLFSTKP